MSIANMDRRYDVTTLEGALAFANDFAWRRPEKAKRDLRRQLEYERDARQKRDLGFTDEEIWKGVWT